MPHSANLPDDVQADAARWLARRDRGLTPEEQDEYLDWLRRNPEHGRTIARFEDAWKRMDMLAEWRPKHAGQPNPDLLAPTPSWWHRVIHSPVAYASLAAAATLAIGVYFWSARTVAPEKAPIVAHSGVKVLPGAEKLTLADGSVVELNQGGRIQTSFTPGERRVRLLSGEALFSVTKNPARPFIVEAGAVAVRAVGTAFDVARGSDEVQVLVTEGKVHVERSSASGEAFDPTPLVAGQRAIVDVVNLNHTPVVSTVAGTQLQQSLGWRQTRLEFSDLALSEVVAEFNLRNAQQQLVIGDAETGNLRLGGTFGADNVDGFVRLLQATLGVKAEHRSDGMIVLRRAH